MSTTINKKINYIFLLLGKMSNGEELYVQDESQKRNTFIHLPRKNIIVNVDSLGIIEWFKMLNHILSKVAR